MRKLAWLAFLLPLLCGCGALECLLGQKTKKGNVEGYVFALAEEERSRNTEPPEGYVAVEDAKVEVEGTNIFVYTDENGYFRIEGLLAGTHTLKISKTGYLTVRVDVEVVAGKTVRVNPEVGYVVLPRATRLWTVMVYMDGDNDLEEAGILDLNEMEEVGSTEQVTVVVSSTVPLGATPQTATGRGRDGIWWRGTTTPRS